MTDWSGHIDVVVLIFLQLIFNVFIYKKIKGERSIIYYGKDESKPYRYDSTPHNSGHRINRMGLIPKK